MKPIKYALFWSLFLGTFIMLFIFTNDHLHKSNLWMILDSQFFQSAKDRNHSFTYLATTLLLALAANTLLITTTLIFNTKVKLPRRKTSTTLAPSPNGASSKKGRTFSPKKFTALWLLYFVPYAIFYIIIFMIFPEQWLWELILNNYDFVGDPFWDSLYEGFIALVALLANVGFICLTLPTAKKEFFDGAIE